MGRMVAPIAAHGMVKPSKPTNVSGKQYNPVHDPLLKRSVQPTDIPLLQSSNVIIDSEKKSISFLHSDVQQSFLPSFIRNCDQYYDVTTDMIKTQKWRQEIGYMLATYFNLPEPCEQWTISSFPANYCFMEVESVLENKTYWCLFGIEGTTFQSTNEFVVHAIWLLSERRLPCQCKYCCHGTEKWREIVRGIQTTYAKRQNAARETEKNANIATTSYSDKASNRTERIRKQSAPRTEILPGVPLVSRFSSRTNDLSKLETILTGEHEGFRKEEVAFLDLSSPIAWMEDGQRKTIESWPVLIKEVSFVAQFEEKSKTAGVQVKHRAQYKVLLLGTEEEIQVDSLRLHPAINNRQLKSRVSESITLKDMQMWLRSLKKSALNLENGKQRANPFQIVCTLMAYLLVLEQKRKQVETTDVFNNQVDWENADKSKVDNIVMPAFVKQEQKRKKSVNFQQDDVSGKKKGSVSPTHSTMNNDCYAILGDDDDSSARRRGETQKNIIPSTRENTKSETIDVNKYWAGLYFGFERIWVGDVVRLCMTEWDLRQIIDSLAVNNDLSHPLDRSIPDLQSPLVMRIKAIYQTEENTKLSIAGDLYRVVNIADAKRTFTEFNERIAENHDQLYQNPDARHDSHLSSNHTNSSSRYGSNSQSLRLGDSTTQAPSYFREPVSKLPPGKKGQLPPSPLLPEHFGYQRINQGNVEIVIGIVHIAGRLYCSMAKRQSKMDPIKNLTGKVRELQILAKNTACGNTKDDFRSNLCLAGLLPGSQLSMGVESCEPFKGSRTKAFERASSIAIASVEKHLSNMEHLTVNDVNELTRASFQPTSEFGKRKNEEDGPKNDIVKRSRSEQLETLRERENPISTKLQLSNSTSRIDARPLSTPENEKENEHRKNEQSTSQSRLQRESQKSQHPIKIFDSPPPGFETKISNSASRFYYRHPETGEIRWGKKVSIQAQNDKPT